MPVLIGCLCSLGLGPPKLIFPRRKKKSKQLLSMSNCGIVVSPKIIKKIINS